MLRHWAAKKTIRPIIYFYILIQGGVGLRSTLKVVYTNGNEREKRKTNQKMDEDGSDGQAGAAGAHNSLYRLVFAPLYYYYIY